jgi:hypothetical protein
MPCLWRGARRRHSRQCRSTTSERISRSPARRWRVRAAPLGDRGPEGGAISIGTRSGPKTSALTTRSTGDARSQPRPVGGAVHPNLAHFFPALDQAEHFPPLTRLNRFPCPTSSPRLADALSGMYRPPPGGVRPGRARPWTKPNCGRNGNTWAPPRHQDHRTLGIH